MRSSSRSKSSPTPDLQHLNDANERLREANEELAALYARARELDRFKAEFLSGISHELRTLLALLLGPLRKKLAAGRMTDDEKRELAVVDRHARMLLSYVDDLLDLSKLDAGTMKLKYARIDLARKVRRLASNFEVLANEREVSYTIDSPESLPVAADAAKIERILLNLLSNAFRLTPTGGTVRCSVHRREDRAILEVQDTGPGIPPHLRRTIFDRIRELEGGPNRQRGGTGLGLSIARQFVELHGGSITAQVPSDGIGSLFRVELPLSAPGGIELETEPEEPDEAAASLAVEELRTPRQAGLQPAVPADPGAAVVLLVEDNPDMNAYISETLASTYRVYTAFDGKEGLEKALDFRPDLIVSDIMMPRMSGDQFVGELRRRPEFDDVPIVLLSAKDDEQLRVKLLREGAQDYLQKPFNEEELLARVGRLIAGRRHVAELGRANAALEAEIAKRKETEEALRQLSRQLLKVRDQERQEIAHELHENTAQCLASLQMRLSAAQRSLTALNPEVQQTLADGLEMLDLCCSDIRTMSYVLHPSLLADFGLKAAMEWHVKGFTRQSGIKVTLEIQQDLGRMTAEAELTLFRILQEALTNVGRHSGSQKALVRLSRDVSEAVLEVVDEGQGIPALERQSTERGAKGAGIAGMRERASNLGGRLEVDSDSHGTTVRAILPLVTQQTQALSE